MARHEEFISREKRRRIKIRLHPIMWKTLTVHLFMLDGLAPLTAHLGPALKKTSSTLKGSSPLLSRPCSNQCFAAPGQGLGRARSQNDTAFSRKAKSNKRKLTRKKRVSVFQKGPTPLLFSPQRWESLPSQKKKIFFRKIAIQNMESSFFQVGKRQKKN